MLAAGSTTVREVSVVKGSICASRSAELARIGHPPAQCAGGGGEWAREQGAGTGSLAALEIAVAGADGVLATPDHIAVHAKAHGAARLAPLGAGLEEHAVEPFRLGGTLHLLRAGDDQHGESARDASPAQHGRRGAQIRQTAVGAAADEHDIHRLILDRLTGGEAHVLESPREHRIAWPLRDPPA